MITDEKAETAYRILVDECGYRDDPDVRNEFIYALTHDVIEFRFMGNLGFGGKIYNENPLRVACYPEDRTVERAVSMLNANTRLRDLERG